MILTLYLTMDCNQRCRYCYAAPHRKANMTEDLGRRTIQLAAEEIVRSGGGHLGIRYFGGEPLLRWELVPRLHAFAEETAARRMLGCSHAISTNAILLRHEHVQFLHKHDFAVGISIDGPREVHDRNRIFPDGSGTFDFVIEKAQMAVEADLRVELVLVADPSNVGELADSLRYLRERTGAYFFTVSFNIHADWSDQDLILLEKAFHELGDLYVERFTAGDPIQIDFLNNKMNVLVRGGFIREYLCEIGKTDLAVTPEGRIYPCLRLAAMDPEGKTAIGTVDTGLDANKVLALRTACDERYSKESLPERCQSCLYPESCLNWCAAANLAMTGHPARVGEVMCRHEKMSVAVAQDVLARIDLDRYRALYAEYLTGAGGRPLTPAVPHGETRILDS
jgi:uncharacterized protein